jgi:hypothetical protein
MSYTLFGSSGQSIEIKTNLLSNVRITAQDFTAPSLREQVALSHSAGVFVFVFASMHGAGTIHIFHSALGSPDCCAPARRERDTSRSKGGCNPVQGAVAIVSRKPTCLGDVRDKREPEYLKLAVISHFTFHTSKMKP